MGARVGMEVPARERITWGRLLAAIALVALSVVVQRDGWRDLALIALNDEEASHIFLVPIIVGWLFFVRRGRLRNCVGRFSFTGTLITAAGAWITYWGVGHGIQMSWHLGSVMMAAGCFITVMGFDFLREFFPCFLLLVFLVPVPSTLRIAISMPLEQFSAAVVYNVMQILGAEVQRSGNLLTVNGVPVTVAEACNGLRMVFGLILVATAFVFGTPLRWQIRALILALSPVLAILLNIVRLVPTMFVFGHTSHATAEIFHDTSGWMMLPLAFLLLVGVQRLARWLCLPVMPYNVVYP
jgi:exosortase